MTLLHGPRSGDLVRARRRHHVPAGPAELGLHPDHGLEHGRAAPGRLPVGDRGQGARREGHPRRPALHAHERDGRPARAASAPAPTSRSSAAIIHHILENGREFREYVKHYTNAPVILDEDVPRHRGPRRLLLGLERGRRASTRPTRWGYRGDRGRADGRQARAVRRRVRRPGARRARDGRSTGGEPPELDRTLEHPHCVFQILQAPLRALHAGDGRARSAACRREQFLAGRRGAVRELGARAHVGHLLRGRLDAAHDRRADTSARPSIIQLLLGNIGRPGGGHPRPARPREHPGLDRHPDALRHPAGLHPDAASRSRRRPRRSSSRRHGPKTGVWGDLEGVHDVAAEGVVGRAATADNDFCFGYLPRIDGDHSHYAMLPRMLDGDVRRASSSSARTRSWGRRTRACTARRCEARLARRARPGRDRDRRVLADPRDRHRRAAHEDSDRGLLPAGRGAHREGRHVHQHPAAAAVAPQGRRAAGRLPLGAVVRPTTSAAASARGSRSPTTRATARCSHLTWDYPLVGPHDEPDAEAVLQEINGREADGASRSRSTRSSQDDGSTSCGSWLHAGIYADGVNQTARRKPGSEQNWIAPEWGWAWPANRRHPLQPRLGRPGRATPGRSASATSGGTPSAGAWTGPATTRTSCPTRRPTTGRRTTRPAWTRSRGDDAVHRPSRRARLDLCAPSGLVDGPLPTHYEPHESPVDNPLYTQCSEPDARSGSTARRTRTTRPARRRVSRSC